MNSRKTFAVLVFLFCLPAFASPDTQLSTYLPQKAGQGGFSWMSQKLPDTVKNFSKSAIGKFQEQSLGTKVGIVVGTTALAAGAAYFADRLRDGWLRGWQKTAELAADGKTWFANFRLKRACENLPLEQKKEMLPKIFLQTCSPNNIARAASFKNCSWLWIWMLGEKEVLKNAAIKLVCTHNDQRCTNFAQKILEDYQFDDTKTKDRNLSALEKKDKYDFWKDCIKNLYESGSETQSSQACKQKIGPDGRKRFVEYLFKTENRHEYLKKVDQKDVEQYLYEDLLQGSDLAKYWLSNMYHDKPCKESFDSSNKECIQEVVGQCIAYLLYGRSNDQAAFDSAKQLSRALDILSDFLEDKNSSWTEAGVRSTYQYDILIDVINRWPEAKRSERPGIVEAFKKQWCTDLKELCNIAIEKESTKTLAAVVGVESGKGATVCLEVLQEKKLGEEFLRELYQEVKANETSCDWFLKELETRIKR